VNVEILFSTTSLQSSSYIKLVIEFGLHLDSIIVFKNIFLEVRVLRVTYFKEFFPLTVCLAYGTESIHPWWIWGYWISPLSYAQNAIAVNEFLAPRWQKVSNSTILVYLVQNHIS